LDTLISFLENYGAMWEKCPYKLGYNFNLKKLISSIHVRVWAHTHTIMWLIFHGLKLTSVNQLEQMTPSPWHT
jgi:hypothetical protein